MDRLVLALVLLDALSAALGLVVAAFFLRAWRTSRDPRHLLFAIGMLLVGASWLTVSASNFDLGRAPEAWDGLRLAGQMGGALVVLFTYLAAMRSEPRPFLVVAGAAAAVSFVFGILFLAVPPFNALPTLSETFAAFHVAMTLAWGGAAAIAGRKWWNDPRASRVLVPAAFACFALSKYTWFIIDLTGERHLAILIYPWRLVALSLLLAALRPRPHPEAHATT